MSEDKFSDEFYDRWQHLLEDIEMNDIPLQFVREIAVNMKDGEVISFNISKMIRDRLKTRDIEQAIEEFLEHHDDEIGNVNFHINVQAVAEEVTDRVSKILDK